MFYLNKGMNAKYVFYIIILTILSTSVRSQTFLEALKEFKIEIPVVVVVDDPLLSLINPFVMAFVCVVALVPILVDQVVDAPLICTPQ